MFASLSGTKKSIVAAALLAVPAPIFAVDVQHQAGLRAAEIGPDGPVEVKVLRRDDTGR